MHRFVHLSDLHIRRHDGADENRAVGRIVEHIQRRYTGSADLPVILITGDITDDGDEGQYANAVELLRPLVRDGFDVLACPGNHDYGPLGNVYTEAAQARFQQAILGELLGLPSARASGVTMEDLYPMVHRRGDVLYVGLDSVVGKEDETLHFASGEVGAVQRQRLREILVSQPSATIVTYFHHHPFNRRSVMEMDDAREVMRLLAGTTQFLCFGHDHVAESWSAAHDIEWIMASGKSTERNGRGKLQYREATLVEDGHEVSMVSFSEPR